MRVVQIATKDLRSCAIEIALKSDNVEIHTYPPDKDAYFFVSDLMPTAVLASSLTVLKQLPEALEKYPGIKKVPFFFILNHQDYLELESFVAQNSKNNWPPFYHLTLPVAPMVLKNQILQILQNNHKS